MNPHPALPLATALAATLSTLLAQDAPDLRSVAEKSDWRATARHSEVMDLCRGLADSSPKIHMEIAGRTPEDRELPILVIADPPVAHPSQVGDRLVAFAWAGIHSGEVCGKPATLMLAREMAEVEDHPLLQDLVVVFLPLLNADGNDRMAPDNRRSQQGPVDGMGTRANAEGLNINRDWTKLRTKEAQAVVGVLNKWSPAIAMDLHTTNGTRHRYVLTYDGQRHPACDDALRILTRDDMLPSVSWSVEKDTGYRIFYYGNLGRGGETWTIDPALPRYSTHYVGMRHHISLLSEAYSYASYEDRVLGTLAFVRHSFTWVADHKEQVRQVIDAAENEAVARGHNPRPGDMIPLRRQPKMTDKKVNILTYDPQNRDQPVDLQCFYNDESESTLSVQRPWAYLVPSEFAEALTNLQHHGIYSERLDRDTEIPVEVYTVASIERGTRPYEGATLLTTEVVGRPDRRLVPEGTVVVRTAQPLGTLAAFLLEPQSEDGLCTWGFFKDAVREGEEFPVLRIPRPQLLSTTGR